MKYKELYESHDYRDFLMKLFDIRRKRNPRYSIRAFSKQLVISHSYFLDICSGKKNLSLRKAQQIAPNMGLSHSAQHIFLELVAGTPLSFAAKQRLIVPETEEISAFSTWYHMVILELSNLTEINLSPELAAKILHISKEHSLKSFRELERIGLLIQLEDGFYRRTKTASYNGKIRNSVIDAYSLQLLDKAKEAVVHSEVESRAVGSKIFPMNSNQFKSLQEKLFSMLHEIMLEGVESGRKNGRDSIYAVSAQMFQLCKYEIL